MNGLSSMLFMIFVILTIDYGYLNVYLNYLVIFFTSNFKFGKNIIKAIICHKITDINFKKMMICSQKTEILIARIHL